MKIVFSRKGFDSAAGGGPSPIVDDRPVSLPIPSTGASGTTWDDLGLGELVAQASRGRHAGSGDCHHDPMFLTGGTCLFGQCGAAQTHLANRGVGVGDTFVFFGLFRDGRAPPHHRIFGYLAVEEVLVVADLPDARREALVRQRHPHAIAPQAANDTIYAGRGRTAVCASPALRLTAHGEKPSTWRRPDWLKPGELSYHDDPARWLSGGRLRAASRGQEFVTDVGRRAPPRRWLEQVIETIERG
ncbi:hypothetical protein N0B51_06070 [Tsuneonella sp. YG55]|uniref:Nucleotide modification associated domain-containing protein n=1 Tax=Tsuneonella litorea TaxID=2976475 RepID=A0A9X3AKY4_9SPHN|nr:hypothetical protein [Tsuneonella litorea]MCT2558543.1 hypothetical protein [Tsuneonella litorea]